MMNRKQGFVLLSGSLLLASTVYACSSSSSKNTPPPVNEAGVDGTSSGSSGSSGGSGGSSGSSGGSGSSSGGTSYNCSPDSGSPPACSSLPGTVVYIESGDTQEPLLKALGRKLRDDANITIAFELTGSCTLSPNLYSGTAIPKNSNFLYIPSTAECPSWTTADAELTCTTDPNNGTPPDLGISALFPGSCAGVSSTPPTGIGSWIGPIQAYTFIVPTPEYTGGQTSISADEAYYAFGDGAANTVTFNGNLEWNQPAQFFLRPSTKSTLVATALNIGLTAKEMTAVGADGGTTDGRNLEATSTEVLTAIENGANLTQAIGILGDEVYDANRGKGASVLAFQAFDESAAYYPDSTTSSFDKQNIRDGHYTLWSPTVYIAPVNGSGVPSNPAVKYITDLVLGNPGATPPNGLVDGGTAIDGLGEIVSVGLTPSCAMQVTRTGDGAPVTQLSTPPASPCTCYFLSKVPGGATLPASCTTCTSSSSCSGGLGCFNGYCEVANPVGVTATAVTKTNLNIPLEADGGLEPLTP